MEKPIEPFDLRNLGIFPGTVPPQPQPVEYSMDTHRGPQRMYAAPSPLQDQKMESLANAVTNLQQENTVLAECVRRLTDTDKTAFQELIETVYREKFPPPNQAIDVPKLLAVVQMMIEQSGEAQAQRLEDALHALYIRQANTSAPTQPAPAEAPQRAAEAPAQALERAAEEEEYETEAEYEEAHPDPDTSNFTGRIELPDRPSIEPVGSDSIRPRTRKSAVAAAPAE